MLFRPVARNLATLRLTHRQNHDPISLLGIPRIVVLCQRRFMIRITRGKGLLQRSDVFTTRDLSFPE